MESSAILPKRTFNFGDKRREKMHSLVFAIFIALVPASFAVSPNCPQGDSWPSSYCKSVIAQNRNRCLNSGNSYFKLSLCCESCETALGGPGQAGKQSGWKGEDCQDQYDSTVCTAVLNGQSVWTCTGAGKSVCRKTCGDCSAAKSKIAAACSLTAACTTANQTAACNANGQNIFKCDTSPATTPGTTVTTNTASTTTGATTTTTVKAKRRRREVERSRRQLTVGKCGCALTAYCDLNQKSCVAPKDCASDRTTDLSTEGCKCYNNKCSKATCAVGKACTGNAATDAPTCSSDGTSTIKGCVCQNNKCGYYAPTCLPGKTCTIDTDCTSDSSDGKMLTPQCLCTTIGAAKQCASGSGTNAAVATCNTANLACTNDASCGSNGQAVNLCFCDSTETVKSCGPLKLCLAGKSCTTNTQCMTDGTDGSTRTTPCKCDPTMRKCASGTAATAFNPVCLTGKACTSSANECFSDGTGPVAGCLCTNKKCGGGRSTTTGAGTGTTATGTGTTGTGTTTTGPTTTSTTATTTTVKA